jgi:hypothetical protein
MKNYCVQKLLLLYVLLTMNDLASVVYQVDVCAVTEWNPVDMAGVG